MPRLTEAQRKQNKIDQLEKTKLVIRAKLDVLNQALADTDAQLVQLRKS